ncbi:hypothetical protein ACFLZG_05845 [Thermodesulfobacteriota bacterium]
MIPNRFSFIGLFLIVLLSANVQGVSCEELGSSRAQDTPKIGIAEDMGEAAKREAAKLKEDIEERAKIKPGLMTTMNLSCSSIKLESLNLLPL